MKAPKLTPEAIAELRADIVTGSLWERYKDGRIVIVHDSGMAFDLVRIKTATETMRSQAWVHINRTALIQGYKPYRKGKTLLEIFNPTTPTDTTT